MHYRTHAIAYRPRRVDAAQRRNMVELEIAAAAAANSASSRFFARHRTRVIPDVAGQLLGTLCYCSMEVQLFQFISLHSLVTIPISFV